MNHSDDASRKYAEGEILYVLSIHRPGHAPFTEALMTGVTIIGRLDADITIPDPAVSATHLELHRYGHVITAKDLGSTNHTMRNGGRLAPFAETQLEVGDRLRLAEVIIDLRSQRTVAETVALRPYTMRPLPDNLRRVAAAFVAHCPDARHDQSLPDPLTNEEVARRAAFSAKHLDRLIATLKGALAIPPAMSVPDQRTELMRRILMTGCHRP